MYVEKNSIIVNFSHIACIEARIIYFRGKFVTLRQKTEYLELIHVKSCYRTSYMGVTEKISMLIEKEIGNAKKRKENKNHNRMTLIIG